MGQAALRNVNAGPEFEPIPDFAVALAMAGAWGVLGLATVAQAFSGFASSSWVLALGALALAAAMLRSGLLFRAALTLLRAFPATHTGQLLALVFGGILLTPLVPLSVARVAAIAPLAQELARALGYAPRSKGSASLGFAGLIGYWYFSSVFLTGLATNFFVVGLLSADDQRRFGWLGWLAAAAPVGIACLIGALIVLLVMLRPEGRARSPPRRSAGSRTSSGGFRGRSTSRSPASRCSSSDSSRSRSSVSSPRGSRSRRWSS